jgi:hypothetical protein
MNMKRMQASDIYQTEENAGSEIDQTGRKHRQVTFLQDERMDRYE